jgi:MFS transporter, NRE family, putaive nickel resistance protein
MDNRNFVLLFSAQIISLTGSGLTTIGLALFAHQLVEGSSAALVIGNALMLRILAFLLFSQFAGILADHINRKQMLIIADVVRFGMLLLFPFICTSSNLI